MGVNGSLRRPSRKGSLKETHPNRLAFDKAAVRIDSLQGHMGVSHNSGPPKGFPYNNQRGVHDFEKLSAEPRSKPGHYEGLNI